MFDTYATNNEVEQSGYGNHEMTMTEVAFAIIVRTFDGLFSLSYIFISFQRTFSPLFFLFSRTYYRTGYFIIIVVVVVVVDFNWVLSRHKLFS